jgi:hypothetical protein
MRIYGFSVGAVSPPSAGRVARIGRVVNESEDAEPAPPTPPSRPSEASIGGLLPRIALVVAALALALAGWLWFNPRSASSEPTYTDAQRADAKTKICSAFEIVRKGVAINTNLKAPEGPAHDVGTLAIAANARVSLFDGGQYLLARLDPATQTDLADNVRKFANVLMDVGAAATAGVTNVDPVQATRLREADGGNAAIAAQCK